jgi:two-component system response regulator NreC
MYSDQDSLVRAIELGANGYILKKAPEEELILGIQKVIEEGSYIDSSLTQSFVNAMVKGNDRNREKKKIVEQKKDLTRREKEILKLVTQGLTDKEIAEDLVISIKTVEAHKHNIKEKLQVKRLAELIRYSIDYDLIDE